MARIVGRLTALTVSRALRTPGMYADGGGLYLRVSGGSASWVYRYMLNRRAREMGLGPLALFGLREARAKALEARRLRYEGVDPIEARRTMRVRAKLEAAKAITFKECAEAYVQAHRAAWRNDKHAMQWEATLATYAEPIIGALPVATIDTTLVMKVLEQGDASGKAGACFWNTRPETASRLRGRIEAILDWARVRGHRDGENPARWRGHLDKLLPAPSKLRRIEHYAALNYADMPKFMEALRGRQGIVARALEFAILTAARTTEVMGARWKEIDLAERLWIVEASRMKAHREHRVPLSDRAAALLEEIRPFRRVAEGQDERYAFVFPGRGFGKPLGSAAFLSALRRMGRADVTVHGFRSSFRDWAAERTSFSGEVAEMALAHSVSGKVEAAYRRSDLLERRRDIMAEWAKFCTAPVS